MKTYKEFLVYAEPFNTDALSSVLWELNISGINEEDYYLKIFSDNTELKLSEINGQLEKLKKEGVIESYRTEENTHDYVNWNEEWEKNTKVIEVSDLIVIKPTFREYEKKKDQTIIIIDPKMSFGTGEHQTTKLSLIFLKKYMKQGYKVLDAGTGTGVLAIAAVLFGAEYALGIDIDEWAEPNFRENASLNNVSDVTEVRTCELKDVAEKDFNLVIANIQKNILMDICSDINSHTKKGGAIILSGLLFTDENDIIKRYTAEGFSFKEKEQMDEWIALVFEKQ
jgi:ribosomal protein L11 methyltransferase